MTTVTSPLPGRTVPLNEVPDPVFADAMVGPGVAIDPLRSQGEAVAPVDGVLVSMQPQTFTVVDAAGRGVLVHLGVDTVQLAGEGFTALAGKGDRVLRGQPLVRWDPRAVAKTGRSALCPVIALEAPAHALSALSVGQDVARGDVLFEWRSGEA